MPVRALSHRLLLAAGLLAATACGREPALEGSLAVLMDLRYQRAEVQASESEVSLRFLSPQGAGEDTVFQVVSKLQGLTLEPRVPVDLGEPLGTSATPRGTVGRGVLDEPARTFPPIARGGLTLEASPTAGATVRGDFHVTFANGTHVYSGRTVFGRFEATVPSP